MNTHIPRRCRFGALISGLLLGLPAPTRAADIYWQTPAGGDYFNTANWLGGVVPGANDTALLSNFVAGAIVTFGGNATNANVQVLGTTVNFWPRFSIGAYTWTVTNQFLVNLDASVTRAPILTGGTLAVTNAAGTAQLLIAPTGFGAFEVLGGNLVVDRLVATNTTDALATFLLANGTVETLRGVQITRPGGSALQMGTQAGTATWTMRGGANVFIATAGVEVGRAAGATANLVVTGPSTIWTNSDTVNIGFFGKALTTITNDAKAYSGSLILGVTASGPGGNELLITGTNSSWTMVGGSAVLNVGGNSGGGAATNRLIIANGGQLITAVSGQTLNLGEGTASSNNLVLVTGAGSQWLAGNNTIRVGSSAPGNQLQVQNGGGVVAGALSLGTGTANASNSVLALSGPNTLVSLAGALTVGSVSSSNLVSISSQARLTSVGTSAIGAATKSNLVLIAGASAIWSNNGAVYVGQNAGGNANQLILTNGGALYATESRVGATSGENGNQAIVTGTNSLWHQGGDLTIGRQSATSNSLLVANGATVRNDNGFVGRFASSFGNVATVTGSGSTWTNAGLLYVGQQGASNHLAITAGGRVFSGAALLGGSAGLNANTATIAGSGSAWNIVGGNSLAVGDGGASLNQLVVTNGGRLNVSGDIYLGDDTGSHTNYLIVTGAGSEADVSAGYLRVGYSGDGNETLLRDGGTVRADAVIVGDQPGSDGNRLFVSGGGVLDADDLFTGLNGGTGTITNNGGVYQFRTATPGITPAGGAISIHNGVISFAGVNGVDITNNWGGGYLSPMTFSGANTFRLNAASNITANQTYTFDTGLGATNYTRLEMVNGHTAYRGGNLTIGSGGSMVLSNTRATVTGLFTNHGVFTSLHSVGTFHSAVVNSGAWLTDPTTNVFLSHHTITGSGSLSMGAGDLFIFASNFVNQSTQSNTYNTLAGKFLFSGTATTQDFATAGKDLGPGWTYQSPLNITNILPGPQWGTGPTANNFALLTLEIANFSTVRVTDAFSAFYGNNDNLRAALYVQNLWLGQNSFLIVATNVSVYFFGTNNWAAANAGYQLLGDAELHQLIPEPSLLLLLGAGGTIISRVWRGRRK